MSGACLAARFLFERKLDDLLRALEDACQMHQRQLAMRARGSDEYDPRGHAAALSQTLQSLYTRLETVLKNVLRAGGEELPDTG